MAATSDARRTERADILRIDIFATNTGNKIKTICLKLDDCTPARMFLAFLNYWERHFGAQNEYGWRSADATKIGGAQ